MDAAKPLSASVKPMNSDAEVIGAISAPLTPASPLLSANVPIITAATLMAHQARDLRAVRDGPHRLADARAAHDEIQNEHDDDGHAEDQQLLRAGCRRQICAARLHRVAAARTPARRAQMTRPCSG